MKDFPQFVVHWLLGIDMVFMFFMSISAFLTKIISHLKFG